MVKTWISKPNNLGTRNGFTLIELLIVLAILAVTASVVIPNLVGRNHKADMTFLIKDMGSQLSLARSLSINENRPVSFKLNVKNRTFNIESKEINSLPENIEIEFLTGAATISNRAEGEIIFYPDGSSTGGKITLSNSKQSSAVEVHWLTGQINHVPL